MSLITWFKDRLFCDLAIDLGTANTLVFLKGRGIIVQEPSIVVVNKISGKVEAVGGRAKDMLGKTPTSVTAIKPMRDGVIADFEIAEKMLDYFIKKATNNRGFWLRPRIVIGIPTGITQVERRAVKDVAMRAKASEVYLVEQPMTAAVGADRKHDRRHRRRDDRYRRHFPERHRLQPLHPHRRQRDGRRDHQLPQKEI
jgi:rod shape-determining protein MreB